MPNYKPFTTFYKRLQRNYIRPVAHWFDRPAHQWATIGGLGALALAYQSIAEGRRNAAMATQQESVYDPYTELLAQYPDLLNKTSGVELVDSVPKPVKVPQLTPPNAETPIAVAQGAQEPEKPKKIEEGQEKTQSYKHAILDEGLGPLVAGAGGGAAGYLGAKYIINPLLRAKEEKVIRQMATGEQALKGLRGLQKIAPIATTTIGALILAALAARMSRQKTQAEMQWMSQRYGRAANSYQQGFYPQQLRNIRDPQAQMPGYL